MPEGAFIDSSQMLFGFFIGNSNSKGASGIIGGRVTDPWMNYMIEVLMEENDKALES